MEKTLEIEVRSLLPGIDTDEDSCIKRLESALQDHRRMQRVHLERSDHGVNLCLHYDPQRISVGEVTQLAQRAGVSILNRYRHVAIAIQGMDCSDCALVVEHSLGRMAGVLGARVNYVARRVWIEYDGWETNQRAIEQRIRSLGYQIPLEGRQKWLQQNHGLLMSLAAGLLLLAGWGGGQFLGFHPLLSQGILMAAYVVGGWEIAQHAFHALKERQFDTDLLMAAAAIGAGALGEWAEGALLVFLFSLGHALEERALEKARSAIASLADLSPRTALVRREGQGEVELPVEQVVLQDWVIIRPGTRIPVDGVILSGSSGIDQSPVTGESIPVDKTAGDLVFAGTINGEGALEVRASRLAADSTLARVMKMVEEAQAQKSPTQQVMERFERAFVPAVLIGTLLVIAVPPVFGVPLRIAFMRAMTLLVAASPCALALGAPASILAGVAQAARGGVLVKGGAHLENLGRIRMVAFDKTGTITHGKPEVTGVATLCPEEWSEGQVLALAAGLEIRSAHPLAQAVVRAARSRDIALAAVGDVESLTGLGLRSSLAGRMVLVGSLKLVESCGIAIQPDVLGQVERLEEDGKTVVLVAVGEGVVGLVELADTLRPGVRDVLARLSELGVEKTTMLTGDAPRVAAAITRQAGLSEYIAGLMPEDKAAAIQSLMQTYGVVAMVGDGVNDAPALAHATVGIAMGGASTDVALETADVALMGDSLDQLPFAIGLGRATRRIILQNLVIAMGVILVLGAASLTGWIGIGTAVFFHEGSTIVVVLNALRLLAYRSS